MPRFSLRNAFLCTCIFLGLATSRGRAGATSVFSTATVLRPGTFSLSGETMVRIDPYDFGVLGHLGFGLAPGFELHAKGGYTGSEAYYGGEMKVMLHDGGQVATTTSVIAGAHYAGNFGLDGTLLASWPLRTVDAYAGLDADVNFAEPKTTVPVNLVLGLQAAFRAKIMVIAELGVNLHENQNFVSWGLTFYP